MVKSPYIVARQRAGEDTKFPEIPQWDVNAPCAGMVVLGSTGKNITELQGMRDNITALWQGQLSDTHPVLVIQFSTPRLIPETLKPRALPLKEMRTGTLSSFSMETVSPKSTPPSPLQTVHVWWNGSAHYLDHSHWTPLSLATLWPEPTIALYESQMFERRNYSTSKSGSSSVSTETNAPPKRAAVNIAEIPQGGKGESVFSNTDRKLAHLGDEFRFGNILSRLFGGRFAGKGGGDSTSKKRSGGSHTQANEPDGPGLFESLAGWVRWHTPLGTGLADKFGDRMSLVEKLISRGDIDSALKLALKLGGAEKKIGEKSRFPLRLPDMRSGLDFNITRGGFSMPILGLQSHFDLANRYTALANDLEDKGDFKRAAYIRSQLLDDHLEGVLTLERGELYEEAAKLALDSGQDPRLIIRLYYKAGKKDIALTLAKRADCFDRLVEDSRTIDPDFHAYVLKAWTDTLLDVGQPLRALEVTDELAKGGKAHPPDPALLHDRKAWLSQALQLETAYYSEHDRSPRIDLIARAILNAHWDGTDLTTANLSRFPYDTQTGTGPFVEAFAHFEDIISGASPETLIPLLSVFAREANQNHVEQSGFWQGPARILIDRFARNLLAHGSQNLTHNDMQSLHKLVQAAKLPVLALDLAKIKTFNTLGESAPTSITIPAPNSPPSAIIKKACLLNNGSMVIWYDTDRLELRNTAGHILWTRQVSDVTDLIPMGTSPSVMVVQKWEEFETRLTRFETHTRRFTDIGILHLVAWHDVMSDGQWLVQIDNQVGAIDITKLCNTAPELEFLWSVTTHNDMQIMAFLHTPKGPSWLTKNVSKARFGVMQVWTYSPTEDLQTLVCLPGSSPVNVLEAENHWQWSPVSHSTLGFLGLLGFENSNLIHFMSADYDGRKKAIAFAQTRVKNGYEGHDDVQVCDFRRLNIVISDDHTLVCKPNIFNAYEKLTLTFEDIESLTLLNRGTFHGPDTHAALLTDISHMCLCTDNYGRLIRIDTKVRRVDIF